MSLSKKKASVKNQASNSKTTNQEKEIKNNNSPTRNKHPENKEKMFTHLYKNENKLPLSNFATKSWNWVPAIA